MLECLNTYILKIEKFVSIKIFEPQSNLILFRTITTVFTAYEVSTSLIIRKNSEIFPTVLHGFKWNLKAILDKGTVFFIMIAHPMKKTKDDYMIHFK
jgi:hypothetical protein